MKISVFLFFTGMISVFAGNTYSQSALLSIDMDGVAVEKVLASIEDQSEFYFLYSNKLIDVERKVSIQADNKPVNDVLDHIFRGTEVRYVVVDRQIILSKEDILKMTLDMKEDLAQGIVITGKVTDAKENPLPGVNILIKGTTTGVISDVDGNFSIELDDPEAILVFSYIGYHTEEVSMAGRTIVNVVLTEESIGLEELVVIGYGTQKRVNLTGAVDQVSSERLEQRPITNVTQGLQGVIPNLNIVLADGKPTRSAEYEIRGTSSVGQGGAALILIDGIEGDPSLLNPNDIESVSVLKDAASAAIYGARGAFGVILITTKSPAKERISVNYASTYGMKSPTAVPDFVTNGYTYAKWFCEAYYGWSDYTQIPSKINKTQPFSLEYLEELERRDNDPSLPDWDYDADGNYVYYADYDPYADLYKENLAFMDQNLSVSGSQDKLSYFLSGRYNSQDGLFRYNSDDYKMYNLRAKGSIKISKWLTVDNNTEYAQQLYHQPINVGEGGGIWRNIADEGHPTAPMFNPDGTLTHSSAYTVGDMWYNKNGEDKTRILFRNTTGLTAKFLQDKLRIKGDFSFSMDDDDSFMRRVQVPFSRKPDVIEYVGTKYNDLTETSAETKYLASNIYAEYENTFNSDHYVKLMTGYNYEEKTWESFMAMRNGILFEDAEDISLAVGENTAIEGGYSKWRISGLFYRFNYSFKDKYLVEFNGRLDASSKFPEDQRSAFFPSLSLGYRISNESFWNVSKNVISDLKIRASYGSLGNGNVNPYSYMELFNITQSSMILNGIRPNMTGQPTIIPEGLTWETSTTTNFGLDASFMNGKLRFSGDIYRRITSDMYTVGIPVPAVYGGDVPKGNYADMETNGWEISIVWKDDFLMASKPFRYDLRFVLADNTSVITKYNNPDKLLSDYYVGMEIGEIWGYNTLGLFTDQADVDSHADQSYIRMSRNNIPLAGDVKFEDSNGDGVVDRGMNNLEDHGDLHIIGNSAAHFMYGINLNADWNNIFISAFFQGVGKQDWWPGGEASHFFGQYNRPYNNMPTWHLNNIWSESNPDAYLPRYRGYIARSNRELHVEQTRYLQNVAYVRLKNLQIGYTAPKSLVDRISFIEQMKIYLSAENVWAWSPLYKRTTDFDVENIGGSDQDLTSGTSGNVLNYPVLKTFSIGLTVQF